MELTAKIREQKGDKVKSLRRQGILPAVLVRKGKESVSLALDYGIFEKTYREAGETTVIKLKIEDGEKGAKEKNVLITETARDPLTGNFLHVDLQEIRLDEKITASVPLVFIGESPMIKEGGTLVKNMQEVAVKSLPNDLPRQIEVDVSVIESFDKHVYVKNLKVSSAVQVLAEAEDVVALVTPPRKEEEVAPAEAPEAAPGEAAEAPESAETAKASQEETKTEAKEEVKKS
jgi:large subunit ribosomal protein L25